MINTDRRKFFGMAKYSALLVLACLFFSCKKDRVCVCGEKVNGIATTFHDTRAKAKKSCKALEEDFHMDCKLD